MTADDISMPLIGVGSIVIPHLSLSNICLIPKLRLNIIFVGQLCDYLAIFSFSFCYIQDLQYQKLIGTSCREKGLYILDELKALVVIVVVAAATTTTTSVDLSSFHLIPSFSSFYL
jgi:hypothetical protein